MRDLALVIKYPPVGGLGEQEPRQPLAQLHRGGALDQRVGLAQPPRQDADQRQRRLRLGQHRLLDQPGIDAQQFAFAGRHRVGHARHAVQRAHLADHRARLIRASQTERPSRPGMVISTSPTKIANAASDLSPWPNRRWPFSSRRIVRCRPGPAAAGRQRREHAVARQRVGDFRRVFVFQNLNRSARPVHRRKLAIARRCASIARPHRQRSWGGAPRRWFPIG